MSKNLAADAGSHAIKHVKIAAFVSAAIARSVAEKNAHSINGNYAVLVNADKSISIKPPIFIRIAFAKTAVMSLQRRLTVDATQGVSVLVLAFLKQRKTARLRVRINPENTLSITRNAAKNTVCHLTSL